MASTGKILRRASRIHAAAAVKAAKTDPLAIPDYLRIPQDVRNAAWEKNPPRPVVLMESVATRTKSEDTLAFERQLEAERKAKQEGRFAKMKARVAQKVYSPETHRWNASKNRFDPLTPDELRRVAREKAERLAAKGVKVAVDRPEVDRLRALDKRGPKPKAYAHHALVLNDGDDLYKIRTVLNMNNAEAVAKLNGVWDEDKYAKLRGNGRLTMTVGNRLRGLVKKGGEVKWAI